MKPASLRPLLPHSALRRRLAPIRVASIHRRQYAVQAPGAPRFEVFDRYAKFMQKERAAVDVDESRKVDYIRDEVAMRLVERLLVYSTMTPASSISPC
jgi:NADH dehydrogenase [ubiquinone] 1 alpha subcomplex assembly factor 5